LALNTNVFSGSFTTALTAFFKTRYPQRKVESLVAYEKPFLEALGRSDELTGIQTIIPMQLNLPQGVSASLRTAIDNSSPIYGKAWTITPAAYYGGMRIDARTLMAAKNDQGAFFRLKEREYEGILNTIGLDLEKYLWGAGTATLGLLSADPGTNTYFDVPRADGIAFHVNQQLRFYADSSGSPGTERAGGARTVTGVNYAYSATLARITVSAAMDAAVGSGDHVCRDGDVSAVLKGIPAWIPSADPGATSFFGVDRSGHPQMLGGWRQSYLGSIEETAKKLVSEMSRFSQRPKTLWLSYANWNRLEIELGARGMRTEDGGKGHFGRTSLLMSTPAGPVTVKAGPFVPDDAGFLLDMSTWKLMSLGSVPHLVEDDGLTARVVGVASRDGSLAEDGIEIRLRYFAQLVCLNPFANGRFAIS
jgi:hypothetical protein